LKIKSSGEVAIKKSEPKKEELDEGN